MLLPCCRHYFKSPYTILLQLPDRTERYFRGAFFVVEFFDSLDMKPKSSYNDHKGTRS
jgi:hypothetical protein